MATTIIKVGVNILEKAMVFMTNTLLQMGYRIEHFRVGSGYMSLNHEVLERGLRTWLTELKLLRVCFELYDATADKAYERCEVSLEYTADLREEVVKPPIEELETLFQRLKTLPPGAQFRVVVTTAPGASEVPGWGPTRLKDLMGGVAENIKVSGHGFGNTWAEATYVVGNWGSQKV